MNEGVARWLDWGREIHAIAQAGHHYARSNFERQRSERLLEIAAEIVAVHSDMRSEEVLAVFSAQPGYVTPKVDVRAAVFREEQLLMVREAADGGWTFPGGWADVGESPQAAIEREVFEEAGLHVRAISLIGVYDANRVEGALPMFHAYKLVFLCEFVSGELRISDETSEVGFFPIDDLPQPHSPYRTTQRIINDASSFYREPSRPTVFD